MPDRRLLALRVAVPFVAALAIGAYVAIAAHALRWSGTTVLVVGGALISVLALLGPPLVAQALDLAQEPEEESELKAPRAGTKESIKARLQLEAEGYARLEGYTRLVKVDAAEVAGSELQSAVGQPEQAETPITDAPRFDANQLLKSELERIERRVVLNSPDVFHGTGAATAALLRAIRAAENPITGGAAIEGAKTSAADDNPRGVREFLLLKVPESAPMQMLSESAVAADTEPREHELELGRG